MAGTRLWLSQFWGDRVMKIRDSGLSAARISATPVIGSRYHSVFPGIGEYFKISQSEAPNILQQVTATEFMALDKFALGGIAILGWLFYSYVLYPFYLSPFAKVPGPRLAAMTSAWITAVDFGGKRSVTIDALHRKYGKVVRLGPNELSFTGVDAMQKIYGAGTAFSKADYFYNIFMAYGCSFGTS